MQNGKRESETFEMTNSIFSNNFRGIKNVKDAVLMTVRDSFHANGIEIPFLQRESHIKDGIQKLADELDAC